MEKETKTEKQLSLQKVQELVNKLPDTEKSSISDGYHSFEELYSFRLHYNALLFNEWAKISGFIDGLRINLDLPMYNVHKSWKHNDGELCFGGGWFVVCAMLPSGMITNHYEEKYWDMFKIPEYETCLYPYDGHTGEDVLQRLNEVING